MTSKSPFSTRNNYAKAKDITAWEVAPAGMRFLVVETARELGWSPSRLRSLLCRVLRTMPDRGNWSDYPNIWDEVTRLIERCDWFRVYDFIEAIHQKMTEDDEQEFLESDKTAPKFAEAINRSFLEDGIGWQLAGGHIVIRGNEAFETMVSNAQSCLEETNRPTAANHIQEALACLSRRPEPDLSGATYHALASLECVARDVTGDLKSTLGEIVKRYPGLLPKPLDDAISKVWGYASNEARHVQEGRDISRVEAQLLVGLSAAVGTYLVAKADGAPDVDWITR